MFHVEPSVSLPSRTGLFRYWAWVRARLDFSMKMAGCLWTGSRSLAFAFGLAMLLLDGCALFSGSSGIGTPPGTPEGSSQSNLSRPAALEQAIETRLVPVVQFRGEETFETLQERMAQLHIPGLSIAVFEDFKVVWAKAYGFADASRKIPVTLETRFQAASISKPVNALTVIRVADKLGISLEAPVNAHLKSWKIPKHPWSQNNPVTIEHLLAHQGGTTVHGFEGYEPKAKLPTTKQILSGQAPSNSPAVIVNREPGRDSRYSGGGVTITQLFVEDQLGLDYAQIAADYTLKPLQMNASSFSPVEEATDPSLASVGHDNKGQVIAGQRRTHPEQAAAGLWTTPSDLASFMLAVVKAKAGLVSVVTAQEAKALTEQMKGKAQGPMTVSRGFFLSRLSDHPMLGHGGANLGFRCVALASLSTGNGFVVMTNGDNGSELIDQIRRTLLSQPHWPGGYETLKRVPLPKGLVESFVGLYGTEGLSTFSIESQSSNVKLVRPFQTPRDLVFVGRGRFVDPVDRTFVSIDSNGGPMKILLDGEPELQARHLANAGMSPLWQLAKGTEREALTAWGRFAVGLSPEQLADYEGQLNVLGYAMAGRGDMDQAFKVLHFVTKARPDSYNALDSLAEIEGMRGQYDAAIEHYKESLRLLKKDSTIDRASKRVTKKRINKTIAELRRRKAGR